VRLVFIGRPGLDLAEVASYLHVPVAAIFAPDPGSLDVLAGRARRPVGWSKRPMLTAARTTALGYPLQTARPDLREPATPAVPQQEEVTA
jgi:hypothetical protein